MNSARHVIDRYYELLAARDREGLLAILSTDMTVTYNAPQGLFPWSGVFRGHDGFDEFFAVIAEHLEIIEVVQHHFISDAERVVVQCTGSWKVKANSRVVNGAMANVFTVADGLITAYEVYADTAAFAAGISGDGR